jgi:hypothetical protein
MAFIELALGLSERASKASGMVLLCIFLCRQNSKNVDERHSALDLSIVTGEQSYDTQLQFRNDDSFD